MNRTRNNYLIFVYVFLVFLMLPSCRQIDVYEKNVQIPAYKWKKDQPVSGTFEISDTSAAYRIYVVLRHTDAYNYNNIWLNIGIKAAGDSLQLRKFDLKLGEDATGWEGTGMNDIWEVRKLLAIQSLRTGKYTFQISHIMRDDPLPHIMSAGLRIEKALDPVNK